MSNDIWVTLPLVIAGVMAVVLLTLVFLALWQDRHHDKANKLRSDAAVDSALNPALDAYDKAMKSPNQSTLKQVEQRLKDILLVVVSFSDVDDDFKALPQTVEQSLVNLEGLGECDEKEKRRRLRLDYQRLQMFHQRFMRVLNQNPGHPAH